MRLIKISRDSLTRWIFFLKNYKMKIHRTLCVIGSWAVSFQIFECLFVVIASMKFLKKKLFLSFSFVSGRFFRYRLTQ